MKRGVLGIIIIAACAMSALIFHEEATQAQESDKNKNVGGIDFVFIPGGSFTMGGDGYTPHKVTVSSFWISKYEVTQDQYQAMYKYSTVLPVCGTSPVVGQPHVHRSTG